MKIRYVNRWYDMDVQLSELVHSLEALSEESQTLFAFLVAFFSDEIVRVKGSSFFHELEWEKIMGVYKSKRGRRWYDQQPILHQAFNKLYSMNPEAQGVIARELYVPSRIVRLYERSCQSLGQSPQMEVVSAIVETSFKEGPTIAQQRFQKFDEADCQSG